MRYVLVCAALVLATACSPSAGSETEKPKQLSAKQAVEETCVEVRAGIDDFNAHDFAGTVEHFRKAKITAKIYSKVSDEPEADALLDAVEYYANLAPADYPEAARTSEHFARNKAITLNQCVSSDVPTDGAPDGTPTQST